MEPRGFRNYNYGNIVDGPFARKLPGYAGSDGRFARFESPEAGIGAMSRLLDSYTSRGFDTTEKIIGRWSPPNENDTSILTNTQARRVGLKPGDRVDLSDPTVRTRFINGIIEQENGRTLPEETVRTAVGGSPMYSPPFDPNQMQRAQGPGPSPFGRLREARVPTFVTPQAQSLLDIPPAPMSPGAPVGSSVPYAPSTPFRDPSLDETQVGENTDVAKSGGDVDWGKVAGGLKGLADSMKPPAQPDIKAPEAPVNRPQVQGLPQLGSNQLLMQIAKARIGRGAQPGPMAGLLGG